MTHLQALFACNNAAVSGGKLPQPLFDAIKLKDSGICAVTRGCRAGRKCNRQRTIRPVIGRRPGFRPTFHQRGVNNNNIIHVKLSTCQIVGNDCYTNVALINARSVKNKTLAINEEIIQHDWEILAITETWLKQTGDEAIVTELLASRLHIPSCGTFPWSWRRSCRSVSEHVQH